MYLRVKLDYMTISNAVLNFFRLVIKMISDCELTSATTWNNFTLQHNVASDLHRVLQISLHLHQNIFWCTAKNNSTGLGLFALCEEGEIFFSVFFDFKEATVGTNIGFSQFVGTAFDRRATGTSDSQIVSFAHTTNSRDSS